jgi:metal-sulfur cluster biosynthetic enzyme
VLRRPRHQRRRHGVADKVLINEAGKVTVELVLTTGWCPFVNSMQMEIPKRLREAFGDIDVEVKSKWDPVWTPDRMSPEARQKMAMPSKNSCPLGRRESARKLKCKGAAERSRKTKT